MERSLGSQNPFSMQQIQEWTSVMTFKHFPKSGTPLTLHPNTAALYVDTGELFVTMSPHDGREFRILTLTSGSVFVVNHFMIPTEIQINENANVGFLCRTEFENFIHSDISMCKAVSEWHQWINAFVSLKLRDLLLFGKRGAVASTLTRLATAYGEVTPEGIRITRKVSHDELSRLVSASREYVNRVLNEYKQMNVLSFDRRYIIIHDMGRLKEEHDCLNCGIAFCRM